MLRVDGIRTGYGRSQVLFGIDLEIGDGEVVALMGRNGMGKTTTIRSIMGLTPLHAGSITFRGQELRGLAPHRIARLGLGLVPEGRGIFPTLTVRENLVATAAARGARPARWDFDRVTRLFPWLDERRDISASSATARRRRAEASQR
jgi:branched-chain amino acid transport system ATP-binding protein